MRGSLEGKGDGVQLGREEGTQGRQVVSKGKVMDCSLGIDRDQRYPAIDPGRNAAVKGWANLNFVGGNE